MYLISIAKAHAFNDANKRTAFQAATGEAERDTAAFVLKVLSDYHNDLLEETTGGY
ncbi:hypothetical protein [Morganella morganii]|uniref:hypothetical protein n=1 Tax=Morganella morganii TaxID=582 RepID=UPI003BF9A859